MATEKKPRTVRIAAAQYILEALPNVPAYQAKLAAWVREAVRNGAELIVFPEYGAIELCALDSKARADAAHALATTAQHMPRLHETAAELARTYHVHILASSGPELSPDGRWLNVARLFTPTGHVGAQAKVIMTPFERKAHIAGLTDLKSNDPPALVFETALGKIAVAICYDSEFPLLVRAMVEQGAEILLIPSCTEFISGSNRIRTAALSRALENGICTVVAQTVGTAAFNPLADVSSGQASIVVPSELGLSDSGFLAEGERDAPGFVYADVDLGHLARIRLGGEMRNNLDWALQPGATPLGAHARVQKLL